MTVKFTKRPNPEGPGIVYHWSCDQCGAMAGGEAIGWGANETNALKSRHVVCRMRRVCMCCKCVLDEGSEGAATSHGLCVKCEADMLADNGVDDAK